MRLCDQWLSIIHTLRDIASFCAENYGRNKLFEFRESHNKVKEISYAEFWNHIQYFSSWLLKNNYRKCRIGVYGDNCYEWILSYFAITCSGNVVVPIDRDLSVEEIHERIDSAQVSLLIYSYAYSAESDQIRSSNLAKLCMNDIFGHFDDVNLQESNLKTEYIERIVRIDKDDLAAIIYTSGTTGKSKGVMLSHRNLVSDAVSCAKAIHIKGGTVLLLPLHHAFPLTVNVLSVMLYGYSIFINQSLRSVSKDLLYAKPQHLSVVPAVITGLYKKTMEQIQESGQTKTFQRMIILSKLLLKFRLDFRRTLFHKFRAAFGGNLELIISGGAEIDEKYIELFNDIGITILNGYGITECSPVISCNTLESITQGSVGKAFSCNQVIIHNPDERGIGEVFVKGQNVMMGYCNDPEKTAKAFTDQWFHTGDLGYMDDEDHVFIRGRIKNLIILSNGKNISPEELENRLLAIPDILEVLIFGQNDRISAEIYPAKHDLKTLNAIRQAIHQLNKALPSYKQVNEIIFRTDEFNKTTMHKIKRETAES